MRELIQATQNNSEVAGNGSENASFIAFMAACFGVLATALLRDGAPAGPGFTVWLLLLGTAALLLLHSLPWRRRLHIAGYVAIAVSASVLLVVHDNTDFLILGLLLVILTAAGMTFLVAANKDLLQSSVMQQVFSMVCVPGHAVLGFFPQLPKLQLYRGAVNPRINGVLRGLVIGLPLLLVFGVLFASADVVVDRLVRDIADGLSRNLAQHLLVAALYTWFCAGLFAGLISAQGKVSQNKSAATDDWLRLGEVEVVTVLGMLASAFIGFVALQVTYLFGGREVIQSTTGLSLAEYARQGFFEMMWVAALTLVVLLTTSALCSSSRFLKPLFIILITCVLIMVISAGQRLAIYIDEFGLTIDRVIASAVMLWLTCSLLLVAALTLRNTNKGLATGISHVGILTVLILAASNPAAVVARVNVERALAPGTTLDADYLVLLGADAVPILLQHLDRVEPYDYCRVGSDVLRLWGDGADYYDRERQQDWRSWNRSRALASKAVQLHKAQLQAMAGRCSLFGR